MVCEYGGTVWHLIGTCRMGLVVGTHRAWSATSSKFHGVENLRVIYGSAMPSMPSATIPYRQLW